MVKTDDVTYTNENGTTAAVGGIAAGTTFDGENITSILENLLYPIAITFMTTSDAGKYCFCYPASYGTLTTILDGNGF